MTGAQILTRAGAVGRNGREFLMLIRIIALILNDIEDAREKLRNRTDPPVDLSVTRLDTEINKDQVYEQTHDHIVGFSSAEHRSSTARA